MTKNKKTVLSAEEQAYFDWEHENWHMVTALEVVGPYSLRLTFDNGTDATINFEQALRTVYGGPAFAQLLDSAYFAQVKLEYGHPTWPNRTDFNPAYLYKWEESLAMMEPVA